MRDACSRFVLTVTLTSTSVQRVRPAFEALFRGERVALFDQGSLSVAFSAVLGYTL